ncbi:MAG TPA: parallel beta-helix domain-containing protein [Bryobacteraceae bacterium]|nr:parallel beta-helix domain-containing protein [Bryobacteraceae bacterium]
MSRYLTVSLSLLLLSSCARKEGGIAAGPNFEKDLQTALIQAKPGAVIELPEGVFNMTGTLSLTVANVTIRGKGIGKTVLSYKNQKTGAAGIQATADHFTLEGLTVQDTKGDGVKINDADGVTIRNVRAEWTGGPNETNGSYGIYPVKCKNVLIEDSASSGAADAGIYVGQSKNIIVRRSKAEYNVAGIEIENSESADVYENIATNNAGGLLVFSLPDLPVKGSRNTRVFNNQVYSNNTPNFAPKGNIVAKVPTGTGVIVMATHQAEVFGNDIHDNNTVNVSIISYLSTGNPMNDASYDPYVSEVSLHDNKIGAGGVNPAGVAAELIAPKFGKPLPGIMWDGIAKGDPQICIHNNGDAKFLNYDAGGEFKKMSTDLKNHGCSLPALAPIELAGGTR